MRLALSIALLLPLSLCAQDGERFAKALHKGSVNAVDRWMERELHRQRHGQVVTTPTARYTVYGPTYDSLVTFLRGRPGVIDAVWDKCMMKETSWPGHSRIGLRIEMNDAHYERGCRVQEGRPENINLYGWRPHFSKGRESLKYLGAEDCPGFIAEQRRLCAVLLAR